jgi:hypothetical protein
VPLFFALAPDGGVWPSAFVAAIFVLHLLHVESVAWALSGRARASSSADTASWARYAQRPSPGWARSRLFGCGLPRK